ncbi:CHAT domain-containing protein [Capilliphycus salinus ALCB114379]|uniref:CHAT domain-containing protein n=1 Tax=Capilliphycus salinus TaxID=2768948 RepID=UPI0039A56910
MYSKPFSQLFKAYLIILSTTFFILEFTQKPVDGQSLIAEISEANYNLCDQLPQSSKLTSEFQANNPQLSEAQRLNEEIEQLFNQGLYARAISVAERILLIYQKTLGDNTLEVATILTRLASLNSRVNNIEKAEAFLKEALKIRESILGADHPAVARIINGLAENYKKQKKYSESESLYKRALSIYEKNCGEHLLVVVTLNDLTLLYIDQRRFEEAESISQKALKIYDKIPKHEMLIDSFFLSSIENNILNSLAVISLIKKDYNQATSLFMQVIENYQQEQRNEHPELAIALNNLAFSQLAQGDVELALTSLTRGMDIEERNLSLNLTIGSEEEKQAYMNTFTDTTYRAISLHFQKAPDSQDAARLALTTILRRKGRVLDIMANSIGLLRETLTSDQQRLFDQLEEYRKRLAMLKFNSVPSLSLSLIEELEAQEKELEGKLLQQSAEFRAEAQRVEIQDIQQLIPSNSALVELVHYQSFDARATPDQRWGNFRYAAYILMSNGQVRWVDLGEAEAIHSLMYSFRRALSRSSAMSGETSLISEAARTLDEKLMQPIRQQLDENIRHLLLSPDARLNLIPFAALMDEQGEYLVENYTLTYLTSGRDLLRLQIDNSAQQPPVIIANPNFEDRGDPGSRNSLVQTRSSNLVSRGMRASYKPLPGTKKEAQAIRNLLPNAIVLTESQATENAIKAAISPQILHLATHGFFLPGDRDRRPENPLLRSGLALAGYNQRSSGGEDGVLTALEVASLNLRGTQLVVLSACQTGLGEIARGEGVYGFGEGVYGLRRAFVIAGARSQLSSLWDVDDFATKELMEKYYQRLIAGEGMSQAWRRTQLEMLRSNKYQHPYYWAAFILSGDWTEISQPGLLTSRFELSQNP